MDTRGLSDLRARRTIDAESRIPGRGLTTHILPTSATMLGVCMTVLSIGRLASGGEWRVVVDKTLAVDALIFLASAMLSFLSMRSQRIAGHLEALAEMLFLLGLAVLAVASVVLAFFIH